MSGLEVVGTIVSISQLAELTSRLGHDLRQISVDQGATKNERELLNEVETELSSLTSVLEAQKSVTQDYGLQVLGNDAESQQVIMKL
jgi:multidrug efflux pump subunit AcrA (membrane-fusion protein)